MHARTHTHSTEGERGREGEREGERERGEREGEGERERDREREREREREGEVGSYGETAWQKQNDVIHIFFLFYFIRTGSPGRRCENQIEKGKQNKINARALDQMSNATTNGRRRRKRKKQANYINF